MVNPNVLSNVPEEQYPTQQRRVQQLMEYLNQTLLQNKLYDAFHIQKVLHKELLTDKNKDELEPLRHTISKLYAEEYPRDNRSYSSKYQYYLEKWEITLRRIAQQRGLM